MLVLLGGRYKLRIVALSLALQTRRLASMEVEANQRAQILAQPDKMLHIDNQFVSYIM